MGSINYKIAEHIATISESTKRGDLELNRVSFNNNPVKYDLRRWTVDEDGEKVPMRGVQLSEAEYECLKKVIAIN
jgi:hypothetical protein